MSAQDIEQRARELPSDPEFWADRLDMLSEVHGCGSGTMKTGARIIRAYAAALRRQPAPVDLGQFRLPVEAWKSHLDPNDDDESEAYDEADRLLALIDSAGKAECPHDAWEENGGARRCTDCRKYLGAASHQPAPVVDDAAKHWHDLYRKECRLRQDDAARYGQKIEDLEAAPVVDDVMVDAAMGASAGGYLVRDCWFSGEKWARELMRAALTAALTSAQGVQS